MVWMAVAVPALEREAQGVLNAGAEVEPLDEHDGHFASRGEVVHRPLPGGLLEHPDDLVALFGGLARRREGDHIAHDLGRVRGVMDQRRAANRDLVAEHRGDLVGVTGAADVAQQRHPVGSLADVLIEPRGLADPRGQQARPQLRFERLAEGVVLCQRQCPDELTEA